MERIDIICLRTGVEGILQQVAPAIFVDVAKWAVDHSIAVGVNTVGDFPRIGNAVVLGAYGLEDGELACGTGHRAVGATDDYVIVRSVSAVGVRESERGHEDAVHVDAGVGDLVIAGRAADRCAVLPPLHAGDFAIAGEGCVKSDAAALLHALRLRCLPNVRRVVLGRDIGDGGRECGDDRGIRGIGGEVGGLIRIIRHVEELVRHRRAFGADEFEHLAAAEDGIGEGVERGGFRYGGHERRWTLHTIWIAAVDGKQRGPEVQAIKRLGVLCGNAGGSAECGEDVAYPDILIADDVGRQHARPADGGWRVDVAAVVAVLIFGAAQGIID